MIFSVIMLNEDHLHQLIRTISESWRTTINSVPSLHPKNCLDVCSMTNFWLVCQELSEQGGKAQDGRTTMGLIKVWSGDAAVQITSMLHLGYDESYKPLMGYQQVLPPRICLLQLNRWKKGKYLKQFPKASVKSLLERGEGGRLRFKCDGKDPQAFTVGPHACELTCQRINREI